MIGAITGDIVGSIYEGRNIKTKEFSFFGGGCRFTDDTVCTVAVADCLINDSDFADYLRQYVRRHPYRGYGGMFQEWASTDIGPYNSWAMALRCGSVRLHTWLEIKQHFWKWLSGLRRSHITTPMLLLGRRRSL